MIPAKGAKKVCLDSEKALTPLLELSNDFLITQATEKNATHY